MENGTMKNGKILSWGDTKLYKLISLLKFNMILLNTHTVPFFT